MDKDKALVVFQDKKIRRTWFNDEWWFSVVDIIDALIDSEDARTYWKVLKHRLLKEGSDQTVTNCNPFKLLAHDGKYRFTDCANTKTLFRLIQSIPSKKAEPFKQWLAQVGYERVEEIQNPELAQERMKQLYEQKGYSKSWIDKRLRGISVRQDLTDEWKKRDVDEKVEFAILTNEISKATFGKTVEEYKQFKGLAKQNLRDHMTDLELIFTMLGEASTAEIEKVSDPKTFDEHKTVSREGGKVAKTARLKLESKTKRKVITNENYLDEPEEEKRKRLPKP